MLEGVPQPQVLGTYQKTMVANYSKSHVRRSPEVFFVLLGRPTDIPNGIW